MKGKVIFLLTLSFLLFPSYYAYGSTEINTDDVKVKISEGSVKINTSNNGDVLIEVGPSGESGNVATKGESKNITFWGLAIPIGIISSIISAAVTFVIYYLNRRNAQLQIKFDLALKQLLPSVYIPLVKELKNKELKNNDIDFNNIKRVILDNSVMLTFAPKELKGLLDKLYIECEGITTPEKYQDSEPELIRLLKAVEVEINKRFGALKG